jgi:serine/arginine repetitive matrix protein 2
MRNTLPALSIPLSHLLVLRSLLLRQLTLLSLFLPSRLINATPSAVGSSSDANTSAIYNTFDLPSTSSPLAPRPLTTSNASRKRLVPKKSKLGLLGAVKGNKERSQNDFSDVVRRIGGTTSAGRDGYEIYVDHTEDPDLEEIVLVKRKKSRLGLDAVAWGPGEENTGNVLKPKASANASSPRLRRTSSNPSHPRTSSSPRTRRTRSGPNPSSTFSSQRPTRTRNGGVSVGAQRLEGAEGAPPQQM